MSRTIDRLRVRIIVILFAAAAIAIAAAAARLTYRNYQIGQATDSIEAEIADLERERAELERTLASLGDVAAVERAARGDLNLQKEGEKVVILLPSEAEEEPEEVAFKETGSPPEPSNPIKWWRYFFAGSSSER